GDRGPTDTGTDTGTDTTGDRGHKVTARRKTTKKGKRSRARSPQASRPPRESEQDLGQLVEQIRPHVPALLERDGNETLTRVQLREILRRQNLPGIRNDRVGPVLAALRTADGTTTARSNR
ncbi:hypothetical protein ACF1BS_23445, partial [Streptomyces sp. NPDC014748]